MSFTESERQSYENQGILGLKNLGNTCYFNSILQCLSGTTILVHYFKNGDFREDVNTDPENKKATQVLKEFAKLIIHEFYGKDKKQMSYIIVPNQMKISFGQYDSRFIGFSQQDAHEALNSILDALHCSLSYEGEMVPVKGELKTSIDEMIKNSFERWQDCFIKNYSFIVKTFYGQFASALQCSLCNHVNCTYDPFSSWSLPIPKGCKKLSDCMDSFIKTERLDEDNQYKCEKCKKMNRSFKKTQIWLPPTILTIVLKRFNERRQKIETPIEIPQILDASPYMFNIFDHLPKIYKLYGVVHHIGSSTGGHYWANCKNENQKWYCYNDANVTEITEDKSANQSTSYILFYERIHIDE